jgi:hypothetical protein
MMEQTLLGKEQFLLREEFNFFGRKNHSLGRNIISWEMKKT